MQFRLRWWVGVVFVRGRRRQGSWLSMEGHVVVRGVVVVCGTRCSRMGRGRPWALDLHEWGVVVVNVGVVRGRSTWVGSGRLWVGHPCGVSSVAGRGRPWGGRVHLCASGDGRLWAVVVVCVCEVVVVVVCGRSLSDVGGS